MSVADSVSRRRRRERPRMVSNDFKQWGGRSYRPRRTDALRATMSGAKAVTQLLAEAGATVPVYGAWRA
jgi:hypothetical protein